MSITLQYAAIAGVAIHPIVKRKEPTAFQFLAIWVVSSIVVFSDSFRGNGSFLLAAKQTALALITFTTALLATIIIYRLSPWHPLASYPGPVLAKLTKWWMIYKLSSGKRPMILKTLHEKYGPWLRIGPNELSVSDPTASRAVYAKLFRAPSYTCVPADATSLINTLDAAEHTSRLISWSKAFNADSLKEYRAQAEIRTDQLAEILLKESSTKPSINLSHWLELWSLDNMGDMSFSGGFETMKAGRDPEGWMDLLQMGVAFVAFLGQVPYMGDFVRLLPEPGPIVTFHKFANRKITDFEKRNKGVRKCILSIIKDDSSGGRPLSTAEAIADATTMILAGSDTVYNGTQSLFRFVMADKRVYDLLRTELIENFGVDGEVHDTVLLRLPYLDACVQEALRMIPPVAPGPPRYTGDNGAQIADKFIPPNTTIAGAIYALNRDARNFKDPDSFIPERWLSGSKIRPHRIEAFIPFGYGQVVCIGKAVALYNMKLITAKLFRKFDFSFKEDFDAQKFDASWKEYNLWVHDPLDFKITSRTN